MRRLLLALVVTSSGAIGCAKLPPPQPFPPLQVTAKRPPRPPSRVEVTDAAIEIKEKVMFEFGKAEIRAESHSLLDDIAKVLTENPHVEVVEVGGHTDSVGSAAGNLKLSADRAASVKKYLASKGIAEARLASKGYGPGSPIADNATDDGREKNRRVEFKILKQGQKPAAVEED